MFFEKMYIAEIDEVSLDIADSFVMCGNLNWEYYFAKKDKNVASEELNNVTYIEFDNDEKFKNFIKNIDYIDFSLENNRFGVLFYAKN